MLNNNTTKYLRECWEVHTFNTLSNSVIKQYDGKTLSRNVAILYAIQTKQSEFHDELYIFDEDIYQFVVDTGTTFHVCEDCDLFTGPITKATDIFIKGVGGQIKVCGHGTIKIRVVDNMNENCDLIITNVLYIPESPTNIISPRLWSELTQNPSGAGEITIGGATLLFGDNNTHMKTITHHPHLNLPMFHGNRWRTMANLTNKSYQVQPKIPQCLHTSVSMKSTTSNGENILHIIPLNGEDKIWYETIPR